MNRADIQDLVISRGDVLGVRFWKDSEYNVIIETTERILEFRGVGHNELWDRVAVVFNLRED